MIFIVQNSYKHYIQQVSLLLTITTITTSTVNTIAPALTEFITSIGYFKNIRNNTTNTNQLTIQLIGY
jgi:hypothetical protein